MVGVIINLCGKSSLPSACSMNKLMYIDEDPFILNDLASPKKASVLVVSRNVDRKSCFISIKDPFLLVILVCPEKDNVLIIFVDFQYESGETKVVLYRSKIHAFWKIWLILERTVCWFISVGFQ